MLSYQLDFSFDQNLPPLPGLKSPASFIIKGESKLIIRLGNTRHFLQLPSSIWNVWILRLYIQSNQWLQITSFVQRQNKRKTTKPVANGRTYQTRVSWSVGMKTRPRMGLSKNEAETCLLQAIRFLIPLSETEYNGSCQEEYNCSCQDTTTFASCSRYTRLMSKTNCPAKLLNALLTSRECNDTQEPWMCHCLRECLGFSGGTDSNLINLWSMPLQAARPSQLLNALIRDYSLKESHSTP